MVLMSNPWDHVQLRLASKRLIPRTGDKSTRPSGSAPEPPRLESLSP